MSFLKNIIIFFFFAKEIRFFTGTSRYITSCFDFIINKLVLRLVSLFGTMPKVNGTSVISVKKGFDFGCKWYNSILKGIGFGIKDFINSSNEVNDNNDVLGIFIFHGR